VIIAMLSITFAIPGTSVAQKATAPKPQDKLALGQERAEQLLLLTTVRLTRYVRPASDGPVTS
jgi:hypothetical protein